jgi:hypothetical protein
MRHVVLLVATALVGCASAPQHADEPKRAPEPARGAQPVVVSIVVDQLAAWIAAERWPTLPADGGFARLRREGTYVTEMRYAHAATDTAPGHAALYTGAPPRQSGIFGNEVIDDETGERVSILRDESRLVGADGRAARRGSGPSRFALETVADRLRHAHADAVIVSLSLKDRGAIAGGGRRPTASLWFDKESDRFVTSTAFSASIPKWAAPLVSPAPFRKEPWSPLDEPWLRAHAATPDAQSGEGDLGGMGTTFPHAVATSAKPSNAFRATPFADDALFALALAAIDGENVRQHPTLIALSLSANDYIGHTFGPDSWEAWDELRRLDASLARFFAALDVRLGVNGWAAILSADHGVTTMPEATLVATTRPWCAEPARDRWERACGTVGRILPDDLGRELSRAADDALGKGAWVSGVADPYVFFGKEAAALDASRRAKLVAALSRTILAHAEVDRVIDTRTLPATCPPESDASIDALVCRAYAPGAGDLYVLPKRGSFFDPSVVIGKGTSHGSPYIFDRTVPLLARAPGRVGDGVLIDTPVSFRAFARTLASLLDVPPPPGAEGAPNLVRR